MAGRILEIVSSGVNSSWSKGGALHPITSYFPSILLPLLESETSLLTGQSPDPYLDPVVNSLMVWIQRCLYRRLSFVTKFERSSQNGSGYFWTWSLFVSVWMRWRSCCGLWTEKGLQSELFLTSTLGLVLNKSVHYTSPYLSVSSQFGWFLCRWLLMLAT